MSSLETEKANFDPSLFIAVHARRASDLQSCLGQLAFEILAG